MLRSIIVRFSRDSRLLSPTILRRGSPQVALETLTGDVTWSFSFVEGHWRGFKGAKKGLPTMDERAPYW